MKVSNQKDETQRQQLVRDTSHAITSTGVSCVDLAQARFFGGAHSQFNI